MLLRTLLVAASLLSWGTTAGLAADPPISLELVTESGFAVQRSATLDDVPA